ncbi:iron chaperone [Rhodococcus sp. NPDC003318]|uniref:iron chaperone n=1 Tax=Rhodococcus sp. NPDC003318 TaxID=3364503 RepID=UPI0036A1DAF9
MAIEFDTVDAYLESFPAETRAVLEQIRSTLHEAVPGAGEKISYQIPTLIVGGTSIVYFAGWKHHVSVYPLPEGDAAFAADLAPYRSGPGTAKFPLTKPIPYDLIGRIASFLVAERVG